MRIWRLLRNELSAYADGLVRSWPGLSGSQLRSWRLRRRLRSLGSRASIGRGCDVLNPENISVGSRFSCGSNCFISAEGNGCIEIGSRVSLNTNVHINASINGRIILGDSVLIGPNVVIRGSDHVFERRDIYIRDQGHVTGQIIIESDVWLGANVTVLKNVRIGQGAVVAAGAVVVADVPAYTVVAGVPARVIKVRPDGGGPAA